MLSSPEIAKLNTCTKIYRLEGSLLSHHAYVRIKYIHIFVIDIYIYTHSRKYMIREYSQKFFNDELHRYKTRFLVENK